jgi:geranylgeranyl pyrophosphate synthase
MSICSGELDESFSTFDSRQTREQYYQRIGKKTASLFSMAAESGAILSKAPEEVVQALKNYGYNLGMGFQIGDDILDFGGGGGSKPQDSDLLRGVFTLPVILFLERYPEDDSIKEVFDSRDNPKRLELAVEKIYNSPIIAECHSIAAAFCSKACSALGILPQNAARQALFNLADYVIEREE